MRFYLMRDFIAKCVAVTYERFDDGKIFVNNIYTNRLWDARWLSFLSLNQAFFSTNRRETLSGKFKLINGENRGEFNIRYERLPAYLTPDFLSFINYNTTLSVLHTDYDNYAIIWSCRNILSYGHAESSWLLTREQEPSEEVLQSAYGYLDKFGLRNYFVKSNQEKCDPWGFNSYQPAMIARLSITTRITTRSHLEIIKMFHDELVLILFSPAHYQVRRIKARASEENLSFVESFKPLSARILEMIYKFYVIFCAFMLSVQAQLLIDGPCPEPCTNPSLNMTNEKVSVTRALWFDLRIFISVGRHLVCHVQHPQVLRAWDEMLLHERDWAGRESFAIHEDWVSQQVSVASDCFPFSLTLILAAPMNHAKHLERLSIWATATRASSTPNVRKNFDDFVHQLTQLF